MNSILTRIIDNPIFRIITGITLALFLFFLIILFSGKNAVSVLKILFIGGWGTKNALTESVVKAIPVMLCAFAVALPAKLGMINIGGEGQLVMGAIGATLIALNFPGISAPLLLLLMGLAAFIFGAFWGLLPGFLKAITRTSEIVISLLLNYVAILFMMHLIHGPWKDPFSFGWAQTKSFSSNAVLPHFTKTRIHILLFVGIIIAIIFIIIVKRTKWGMNFRVINASPASSEYLKINFKSYYIFAFMVAGGIAAWAGFGEVSVVHGKLREGISMGYGYTGFLVAWLCSNKFSLIPVVSLLIGGFLSGADVLQISAGLPFATINILQGLILIMILIVQAREMDIKKTMMSPDSEGDYNGNNES